MATNRNNWTVGEVATLPRQTTAVRKGSMTQYEHLAGSRYLCVREESEGQRGILVKVLGKVPGEFITTVGGEPFCKDDKEELFVGEKYYSYRFPRLDELREVLELLRGNEPLLSQMDKLSMHVNPESTFWVRDTERRMLFLRRPQYYDARTGRLAAASDGEPHYRLTIAYFYKGAIIV